VCWRVGRLRGRLDVAPDARWETPVAPEPRSTQTNLRPRAPIGAQGRASFQLARQSKEQLRWLSYLVCRRGKDAAAAVAGNRDTGSCANATAATPLGKTTLPVLVDNCRQSLGGKDALAVASFEPRGEIGTLDLAADDCDFHSAKMRDPSSRLSILRFAKDWGRIATFHKRRTSRMLVQPSGEKLFVSFASFCKKFAAVCTRFSELTA
jgi:hypothetical protein